MFEEPQSSVKVPEKSSVIGNAGGEEEKRRRERWGTGRRGEKKAAKEIEGSKDEDDNQEDGLEDARWRDGEDHRDDGQEDKRDGEEDGKGGSSETN